MKNEKIAAVKWNGHCDNQTVMNAPHSHRHNNTSSSRRHLESQVLNQNSRTVNVFIVYVYLCKMLNISR